jgi:hypothetical protein
MVETMKKWSECMASKGYNYHDPIEASTATFDLLSAENDWDTPRKQEQIETAIADVTCKNETNLVSVWLEVIYEHEKKAVQENLPLIEKNKKYDLASIARSQEIIKEYG